MTEGKTGSVGPIETPDYSKQPAVVGDLIVAESAHQHALALHSQARASLATERKNLASLQLEVGPRAKQLIADVTDFSHSAFVYDDLGHTPHPRNRSLVSSSRTHTFTASRDYVIDDNGEPVEYTVINRRTTLRGRISAESLTILKPSDRDYKLSLTTIKKGRSSESIFHAKDGRGSQDLSQGLESQAWHGKQQHNPGHEYDELIDVLVSFRWFMDRLHSPLRAGEIEDLEEQVV